MLVNVVSFLQDEAIPGTFHSLPYQLANAVVRTVTLHAKSVHDAKDNLNKLLEADPMMENIKTKKAKELCDGLSAAERHAVLNRRTGYMATADWLQRHISVNEEGMPVPKKAGSTCKPWVLTIKILLAGGGKVKLSLRPKVGKPFRALRCLDIRAGISESRLSTLTSGYGHLFDDDSEDPCLTWNIVLPTNKTSPLTLVEKISH